MIQTIKMAELPEVTFWKEQKGVDWYVGLQMGDVRQTIGRYWSERLADEEISSMQKKLKGNLKRTTRELRKSKPAHVNRKMLQVYLMALSKERCAQFLEGMFTLNVLLHMLTYCFDEMEGNFDEMVDSPIRQTYTIVKKQLQRMIDGLYESRQLGENDEGYNEVSGAAYKLLPMVNQLANYGLRGKDAFRMNEVAKAMQKVMPDDVLLRERETNADNICSFFKEQIVRYVNASNQGA